MRNIYLLLIFLLTNTLTVSYSQVVINEILASNSSINSDPDYGANADWVELYNTGNTAINLIGYYLTDDFSKPEKWKITQNINLASHGYLIIWTDDMQTGLHTNFKLSASGEQLALYLPNLTLADSLTFGAQNVDISYGRCPDGTNTWSYFAKPTPGSSNGTTLLTAKVDNSPEFLLKGGFYSSPVSVRLFTDLGGTIRYTIDGSEPVDTSIKYTDAIPVSKTTIIRARIFKPNQIPGNIVSQSYFINEGFENRKLPVVSIATNPENFWDPVKGIYVQSFKPDWEIPVNIEFFLNDGGTGSAFNLQAGIKVNGLYSWQLPQKMLGVYFKKQYGEGTLAYQLFLDRERKTFKDFALRASGNDWSNTMFRDGLIQQACHNYNMKLDNMGFRPSIVYVNGQYMGIHNIREKVDEDYIASNYNLSKDSFDIIENEDYVESGSLDAYNAFKAIYSKDLTVQTNYDAVDKVMDIENFTDLVITEMYTGNSSIDHNVMAWKPKNNGKWRWILMDLDRGFFGASSEKISFYISQTVWPFSKLMKNTNYTKYFGTRLANHLYTTYNPIRMDKRIDYHKSLIEAEMPNHIARWLGTTSSYGNAIPSIDYWNNEVLALKTFADARPAILLNDLQSYGFSSPSRLSLSVEPSNAGEILFNGMKLSESTWDGIYPKDLPISLTAVNKPGYTFKGWASSTTKSIIPKQSTWNYIDDGTDYGTAWFGSGFNDTSWKTGTGKFGYGDTQQTVVSYGPNSSSKYITTYFRKTFDLSEKIKSTSGFILNLLRDDGAVVYLNGKEVVRSNMPVGEINYKTLASNSVNGTEETTFISYIIDASDFITGNNVIAVEVHQNTVSSSDLGFDLELLAQESDTTSFLSTATTYDLTLSDDRKITAVYQSRGQNLVPDTITKNMTFYKAQSPYVLQGNVVIPSNVTLTIEPGVDIYMPPGASFIVNGSMRAIGTAKDRIMFRLNPDYTNKSWGALCFINATDTIRMSYVTVEDASKGPVENRDVAAISSFKSDLLLDDMMVVSNDFDPIVIRYGSVKLTNSTLHSNTIGNLINVKNGKGRIENCILEGNNFPDTDAIDYDDVDNGVIKNMLIRNFGGSNSDAIDLGESTNVRIDSVIIYNIFDKGVSVGLRSTLTINNATIMNTTLGFGIKDSSRVTANACTFYNVGTPIANYEKIVGRAGGNAFVTNSIMSNSYNHSYTSDNRSYTNISYSFSDTDTLPDGHSNLFGNPLFNSPGTFDFGLGETSPVRMAGFYNGSLIDMGSAIRNFKEAPFVLISDIFYNLNKTFDRTEFIKIYNPSDVAVDLSGYTLSEAFEFTFPEGSIIKSKQKVFVAKDLSLTPEISNSPDSWNWTSGSLANEGETIRLSNKYGIVIDQVSYKPGVPWPNVSGTDEKVISIISPELDNHFGENWKTTDYSDCVGIMKPSTENFTVFPNPTKGNVTVQTGSSTDENLEIFTLTGLRVYSGYLHGQTNIDLSRFGTGVYIAKIGDRTQKIVVLDN
jgi:hypothetical protein